jgi:NAD-dependent dihydropyrimidine dehydrogenase PreA subunit
MVEAVRPTDCVDCLICVEHCPKQAIQLFFKGEKFFMNAHAGDIFK